MSIVLDILRVLPKNILSSAFGKFALIRWPGAMNRAIISRFAKTYGANLAEATRPIEDFPSLADFFVRDLRPGARPVGEGAVSPADGVISEHGIIARGELLQAKGISYPLNEFLGVQSSQDELSARFEGGYYVTVYLAPGDYHHVHSPVEGEISQFVAIPGTLWPVNSVSVRKIPKVFCQNERVISYLQTRDFGTVAVVKVGATNVGSIALAYDPFVSNRSPVNRFFTNQILGRRLIRAQQPFSRQYREKIPVARGEKLATFRLGSTVVLLFERGKFIPGAKCREGSIRYGEQLGSAEIL